MYEMEGPRPVPPRTADPVARVCALRRDICLTGLASRLPGHRLRCDSRLAAFADRFPGRLVRLGSRRAALTSQLPSYLVRRGVRSAALANRSLGHRVLRSASCPQNPASPVNAGLLDPPSVPWVSPEADPVFSSEEFLRPAERAAQGLFRDYFKILFSSTGHLAFIPRA